MDASAVYAAMEKILLDVTKNFQHVTWTILRPNTCASLQCGLRPNSYFI
jgi:hypothetical protein